MAENIAMLDKKNDSIPKEQYHLILWLKFVKKTELQYIRGKPKYTKN